MQSRPEPGLAILTMGRRDVSYDIEMPRPLKWFREGMTAPQRTHADWHVQKLNDQHASHYKRHAQAGMVMVNVPTAGVDYHVPFGGRKGSSYGPREQGCYAAEFFTTVKTAYIAP